ncbi:hypothetical protein [Metallosphaera tengchongensis]|nr:hypothetical protein [Metallosphaera tengchongensis]
MPEKIEAIEPWGVNIPFILVGLLYWFLGGVSLNLSQGYHPYFMMIGSYSLYFGMIMRLFFPAKKYLPLQVMALFLLGLPMYPSQALASLALLAVEIWGIRDVRSYGGRFPVNALVLSSPAASIVSWLLYPIYGYWLLVVSLLLYLLGVNMGVFSANLGVKAKFGVEQTPIFVLVLLTLLSHKLLPVVVLGYLLWLLWKTKKMKFNLSSVSTILASLVVTSLSPLLGETVHSFALGVMAPYFFGCIVYSTSRYNYQKVTPIPLITGASYFLRFVNLEASAALFGLTVLYFLYLFKDNLTFTSVRLGMSSRYLKGEPSAREVP